MPRRFRNACEFTITYFNPRTRRINLRNTRFHIAIDGDVQNWDGYIRRGLRVNCIHEERNTLTQRYDFIFQYTIGDNNYQIYAYSNSIRVIEPRQIQPIRH